MIIPRWPAKAVGAIRALFQTLQDIDIYVEDRGSEAFYGEIFRRLAPEGLRIQRILPMEGRDNVTRAAQAHDFAARRALFLIDGDLDWVRGEPPPVHPGLYQLDAYCIENLLICEAAATRFLMESEACSEEDARSKLDFVGWVATLEPIQSLFAAWATLQKLDPDVPTVSNGIGSILDGARPPAICPAKTAAIEAVAAAKIAALPGGPALLSNVQARIVALSRPIDAISGKDFSLPALDFHIRTKTSEKANRKSFRFRLALHASLERFNGLREAVLRASRGQNSHV